VSPILKSVSFLLDFRLDDWTLNYAKGFYFLSANRHGLPGINACREVDGGIWSRFRFFDVDNIPLGVDFRRHLGDAVAGCDVLLALVGDQWLTTTDSNGERRLDNKNDFNRIEIEAALTRGIPVVPVLAGHATMPSENDLPESLRELAYRNAIELRSGGDLREYWAMLVAASTLYLCSGRITRPGVIRW
jgi:hypothetical protein